MKKGKTIALLFVILFFVFLSAWQMLHGSIIFHTDIARDFLLIEDIFISRKPALIGPRSGGIPGVFHGPLWLYLNVPAYVLGKGNPVVVGWFWVFLFLCCLLTTYWVGKKLFSKEVGLLAALLLCLSSFESIPSLFNPFGAVILSPLFLLFFIQYIRRQNAKDLLICLFIAGLIIQFQMAFGVPILVLSVIPLLAVIIKSKKINHLAAFFILLIPLSTFILFDLRHQFLQVKSVLNYVRGVENMGKSNLPFANFLLVRLKEMILESVNMFTRGNLYISICFFIIILASFFSYLRQKQTKSKRIYFFITLFYAGFWFLTLAYKGVMWGYYFWPFLPLLSIMFSGLILRLNKYLVYFIVGILVAYHGFFSVRTIIQEKGNYVRPGSWSFYLLQAQKIFEDEERGEFGYFIYTADQFGYSTRYALNYAQKLYPQRTAFPYQKKKATYLVIFPSTNRFTSETWWKKNQVKIMRGPDKVFTFDNGSYIEKYVLSDKEQKIESDPNLIHSLIFR